MLFYIQIENLQLCVVLCRIFILVAPTEQSQ